MLKKQRRFLKAVIFLLIIVILTTFLTHHLSVSLTSTWIEEKWLKQKETTTVDPWLKKGWNHVKVLTDVINYMKPKRILLWTKFFGAVDYVPKLSDMCPMPICSVTSNRNYFNQSEAVIFHLRDVSLNDLPLRNNPKQVWILLHHESPPHTPELLNQLNGLFNWTATYRFDSEILLTPLVKKRKQELSYTKSHNKGKRKMIAWFVSNCKTPGNREGYVKELQKVVPVDIYGSCGTLSCLPKMSDECYAKAGSEYRFYLAFENSVCKDYVTEKFYHILATDMVPVVFGGANYSTFAPPSSYINALSFKTPRDLGKYLLKVAKDDQLYDSFFEWRKKYEITSEHYACKICQRLHSPEIKSKTYSDISKWWFGDARCKAWPF